MTYAASQTSGMKMKARMMARIDGTFCMGYRPFRLEARGRDQRHGKGVWPRSQPAFLSAILSYITHISHPIRLFFTIMGIMRYPWQHGGLQQLQEDMQRSPARDAWVR
jgi:hypothetical protein